MAAIKKHQSDVRRKGKVLKVASTKVYREHDSEGANLGSTPDAPSASADQAHLYQEIV